MNWREGLIRYVRSRMGVFWEGVGGGGGRGVRLRDDRGFSYWEKGSSVFGMEEKGVRDVFWFWKIEEGKNEGIDIGRGKRLLECMSCGWNGIDRYRKKGCEIEIFCLEDIWIVNRIYKDG